MLEETNGGDPSQLELVDQVDLSNPSQPRMYGRPLPGSETVCELATMDLDDVVNRGPPTVTLGSSCALSRQIKQSKQTNEASSVHMEEDQVIPKRIVIVMLGMLYSIELQSETRKMCREPQCPARIPGEGVTF